MIINGQKTSLLVNSQLPQFVRDNPDYENFNLFVTAYYEWMEQNGKVTERAKNLLNYKDIDSTTDEFIDYFTNEFLPYFPKDALIDERRAIKIARQLYQTKGTPASYQFLFKILYNSDFDIFYTKDAVLKASAGTWYVAKSLKLATEDSEIRTKLLDISNYRLFGETTKSIATVESSIRVGAKIEVFISNIERLFQSGEIVRVVDNANQTVLFNGQPIRAKIVGQVSQIKIDPKNRGLFYDVGDPVVLYNGLSSNTGIGATAVVAETTTGSIQSIGVLTGGYGYSYSPNTQIVITPTYGATAIVASFDPDYRKRANVSVIPIDSISLKKDIKISNTNYHFSNILVSNVNTTLINAFSFTSFTTYPISSVIVTNGGGGVATPPAITAQSNYTTDIDTQVSISSLGILAPIQITNGGLGYEVNDQIIFTGGTGMGAAANVITVAANGAITNVAYVNINSEYPVGGMGYSKHYLPAVDVVSANVDAFGAALYVPGILGDGATFDVVTDRAGAITKINIVEPGEDYIATPNVSLKVQDIVVSNVSIITEDRPVKGDVIYQGPNINSITYLAMVDSVELLSPDVNSANSLYQLRVFNYNSNPDPTKTLNVDRNIHLNMYNAQYDETYNENGFKNYGDGTAKASAVFLNGLVVSQGQYLNTQGQPSSFDVLQSKIYNNFTYQITVEKEISKYRSILLELLHPTGMNVIGRNVLKSNNSYNLEGSQAVFQGHTLEYYTNYPASGVTMTTDFTNKSNNIISFNNLAGSNIANYIFTDNSSITIKPTNGPNVYAEIVSVDSTSNTITISSNVWLTFANVATVTGNSGSNVINITSLTGSYDIVNNGNYSDMDYPLKDIVYAGDKILVDNNTSKTVSTVDYINGIIYLTTNLSSDANSYMAVNRTFFANSNNIIIYGAIGLQYIPELTTEDGATITTEDGRIILLG